MEPVMNYGVGITSCDSLPGLHCGTMQGDESGSKRRPAQVLTVAWQSPGKAGLAFEPRIARFRMTYHIIPGLASNATAWAANEVAGVAVVVRG